MDSDSMIKAILCSDSLMYFIESLHRIDSSLIYKAYNITQKQHFPVFNGKDLRNAYIDGYLKAWEDIYSEGRKELVKLIKESYEISKTAGGDNQPILWDTGDIPTD